MKIHNPFKFARKNAFWAITLVFILTSLSGNAQAEGDSNALMFVVGLVAIIAVLVLLVAIYALQVISKLEKNQPEGAENEDSLWSRFLEIANNRAPEEKEADILLDHNYDGIRELDNHLPPWWKWLFYLTIIWGVVYLIGHHFTGWFPLQEEEYEIEMAEAKKEKEANLAATAEAGGFDESKLVYSADAGMIEAGKKIFGRNCTTCHGQEGGGIAGPNLTDDYWVHGGSIKDIFRIVKEGVPNTAMIQWSNQLSPTQIQEVSYYVMSLRGTNPENALKPQGTLYEEGAAKATPGEAIEAAEEEVSTKEPITDATDLAEGKTIYDSNCAACHLADGGGIVGPNLTDNYWKSSNGSKEGIKKTIIDGVAGTSMMAWSAALNETQIEAVTNYIISLKGTSPATPKEPEGELYE